ncbi:MAG: ArsR/SmtB family transcription factor [Gemmatimonadales bacterium]
MVTHNASARDAFRALAHPTRRTILDMLRVGAARDGLPVGAIAVRFGASRPAISRHLRILRAARLVVERRAGRVRLCRLNPTPLKPVDEWLDHYRRFWPDQLRRLKRHVEAGGVGGSDA